MTEATPHDGHEPFTLPGDERLIHIPDFSLFLWKYFSENISVTWQWYADVVVSIHSLEQPQTYEVFLYKPAANPGLSKHPRSLLFMEKFGLVPSTEEFDVYTQGIIHADVQEGKNGSRYMVFEYTPESLKSPQYHIPNLRSEVENEQHQWKQLAVAKENIPSLASIIADQCVLLSRVSTAGCMWIYDANTGRKSVQTIITREDDDGNLIGKPSCEVMLYPDRPYFIPQPQPKRAQPNLGRPVITKTLDPG